MLTLRDGMLHSNSAVSQAAPVQAVMIDMEIIEAEQDRLKDVEKQKQQKLKNEEKRLRQQRKIKRLRARSTES